MTYYAVRYVRTGADGQVRTREKIIQGSWHDIIATAHSNTYISAGEKIIAIIEVGYH
jgi:hypothetical protein